MSSIVLAAILAAAAPAKPDAGVPGSKSLFSSQFRRAYLRTTLPDAIQVLLPWQGLYAAGHGDASPAWRVVVTMEGDLRAGSNARPGSSSTEVLDRKRKKLDPALLRELFKLADKAWREKRPPAGPPVSDYQELLIVADAEHVFVLDPKTAIRGGAAEQLVRRLQQEAAR